MPKCQILAVRVTDFWCRLVVLKGHSPRKDLERPLAAERVPLIQISCGANTYQSSSRSLTFEDCVPPADIKRAEWSSALIVSSRMLW